MAYRGYFINGKMLILDNFFNFWQIKIQQPFSNDISRLLSEHMYAMYENQKSEVKMTKIDFIELLLKTNLRKILWNLRRSLNISLITKPSRKRRTMPYRRICCWPPFWET